MNATTDFKRVIGEYLEQRAEFDELFAMSFAKLHKNLDDCITYILNWVHKSGCVGFCDDEIFSQAIHYYDEDDIEIGNPINCKAVVNHVVELSEEEKEQARENAIKRVEKEHYDRITKANQKPKKVKDITPALSLFDFEN